MQIKFLAIYICLFLISTLSTAQNFNKDIIPRINTVYVGIGSSFMYADNAGGLRKLRVKVRPSASLSYGRKINSFLEIRGTLGFQLLESQSPGYFSDSTIIKWRETGQAIGIKGNAYHVDVMPLFHLFPYETHIGRTDINVFAGIGIGVMGVNKEEVRLVNNQPEITNSSISLSYIPIRGGISYRIGPHSDVALEGTFYATFSDEIDGNVGFNRFNDHLFQGQVVFKRYLSPFPFWLKYMN